MNFIWILSPHHIWWLTDMSAWKEETGRFQIKGQPGLYECLANLCYRIKSCLSLKKKKKKKTTTNPHYKMRCADTTCNLCKCKTETGGSQVQGQPELHSEICQERQTLVLNLWVKTPLGVDQVFHRGRLRPSENTDIYITIHDSSKITVTKYLWK